MLRNLLRMAISYYDYNTIAAPKGKLESLSKHSNKNSSGEPDYLSNSTGFLWSLYTSFLMSVLVTVHTVLNTAFDCYNIA